MSGHNKWAKIKRKKGANDAKRGRMFTRFIREITIAARDGGGNTNGNPRLRFAVEKAQAMNMPAENIKRAIQKGTGELPGQAYEECTYEGYGPGGVALIVETVTDNKNRTVSELKFILDRHHGKLGAMNSVAWMFHKKGIIRVARTAYNEDELFNLILEAGADDMRTDEDSYEIVTAYESFEPVRQLIESKSIKMDEAELQMIPENLVKVEGKEAEQVLKLMEAIEDCDDVQHVYANFDIDENVMASLQID